MLILHTRMLALCNAYYRNNPVKLVLRTVRCYKLTFITEQRRCVRPELFFYESSYGYMKICNSPDNARRKSSISFYTAYI